MERYKLVLLLWLEWWPLLLVRRSIRWPFVSPALTLIGVVSPVLLKIRKITLPLLVLVGDKLCFFLLIAAPILMVASTKITLQYLLSIMIYGMHLLG